jgi:hypothetical protein
VIKPIRFDPEKNLAPTAFDERICRLASRMKRLGLNWQPHVGCFVWDPDNWIKPESPFPGRIYFVLSMPRFVEIFGSVDEMARKLVWLPTWHQACLIWREKSVTEGACDNNPPSLSSRTPTEELIRIYELIIDALQNRRGAASSLSEHP